MVDPFQVLDNGSSTNPSSTRTQPQQQQQQLAAAALNNHQQSSEQKMNEHKREQPIFISVVEESNVLSGSGGGAGEDTKVVKNNFCVETNIASVKSDDQIDSQNMGHEAEVNIIPNSSSSVNCVVAKTSSSVVVCQFESPPGSPLEFFDSVDDSIGYLQGPDKNGKSIADSIAAIVCAISYALQ